VKRLGIPDQYIEHGTQDQLYAECGYDVAGMIRTAVELVGKEAAQSIGA
jgi:1-deoxy-D-xylulose-5-phosphate synthase